MTSQTICPLFVKAQTNDVAEGSGDVISPRTPRRWSTGDRLALRMRRLARTVFRCPRDETATCWAAECPCARNSDFRIGAPSTGVRRQYRWQYRTRGRVLVGRGTDRKQSGWRWHPGPSAATGSLRNFDYRGTWYRMCTALTGRWRPPPAIPRRRVNGPLDPGDRSGRKICDAVVFCWKY